MVSHNESTIDGVLFFLEFSNFSQITVCHAKRSIFYRWKNCFIFLLWRNCFIRHRIKWWVRGSSLCLELNNTYYDPQQIKNKYEIFGSKNRIKSGCAIGWMVKLHKNSATKGSHKKHHNNLTFKQWKIDCLDLVFVTVCNGGKCIPFLSVQMEVVFVWNGHRISSGYLLIVKKSAAKQWATEGKTNYEQKNHQHQFAEEEYRNARKPTKTEKKKNQRKKHKTKWNEIKVQILKRRTMKRLNRNWKAIWNVFESLFCLLVELQNAVALFGCCHCFKPRLFFFANSKKK